MIDNTELLERYLLESLLNENVREWMVIINKGLLGNKRVVYSTDKKDKAKEKFLWYRDMYPEYKFKLMTKTDFRAIYHRFPEYVPAEKQEELFKPEEEIKYGKNITKKHFVYSPKHKTIKIKDDDSKPKIIKQVIKQVLHEPEQNDDNIDSYVATRPETLKTISK